MSTADSEGRAQAFFDEPVAIDMAPLHVGFGRFRAPRPLPLQRADSGEVLLDTLVRPERHRAWLAAQRIHGIAPAAVAAAPTLPEIRPRIGAAVAGARVAICNAPFDSGFLVPDLAGSAAAVCAMRPVAEAFGEWDSDRGSWRRQKPGVAAAHAGFQWPGTAHRAIHDCQATRAAWRWLAERHTPAGAAPSHRFQPYRPESGETPGSSPARSTAR